MNTMDIEELMSDIENALAEFTQFRNRLVFSFILGNLVGNQCGEHIEGGLALTSGDALHFGHFRRTAEAADFGVGVAMFANGADSALKAAIGVVGLEYLAVVDSDNDFGIARAVVTAEDHHVPFSVNGHRLPTIHIVGKRLDSCALTEDVAESVLATLVKCYEF